MNILGNRSLLSGILFWYWGIELGFFAADSAGDVPFGRHVEFEIGYRILGIVVVGRCRRPGPSGRLTKETDKRSGDGWGYPPP